MPRTAAAHAENCLSTRAGQFRFCRHSAIMARQPGNDCRPSEQSMPIENSSSTLKHHTFKIFVSPRSRLADQEVDSAAPHGSPGARDERRLVGHIDPSEQAVIQRVRRKLRLRHKALPTERDYVGWLMRFIQHCGSPHPERFGEREVKDFLTSLAAPARDPRSGRV